MTFKLVHMEARQRAIHAIANAPEGYVVTVKEATRSLDQNAKLWPMLSEISAQVDWYGNKLSPDEWKDVFTAALKRSKVVPGLDGGFVVVGARTSQMGKREFADLIELINAFAAERGVEFKEVAA